MKPRIAVMGAGAVGGYVGGHLSRLGHDVTLIEDTFFLLGKQGLVMTSTNMTNWVDRGTIT